MPMKQKPKALTYPYIRAWGKIMGSFGYYIEDQIALAVADNAPQDAIFKDLMTNRWHTVDRIQDPQTRARVEMLAEEYKA